MRIAYAHLLKGRRYLEKMVTCKSRVMPQKKATSLTVGYGLSSSLQNDRYNKRIFYWPSSLRKFVMFVLAK